MTLFSLTNHGFTEHIQQQIRIRILRLWSQLRKSQGGDAEGSRVRLWDFSATEQFAVSRLISEKLIRRRLLTVSRKHPITSSTILDTKLEIGKLASPAYKIQSILLNLNISVDLSSVSILVHQRHFAHLHVLYFKLWDLGTWTGYGSRAFSSAVPAIWN